MSNKKQLVCLIGLHGSGKTTAGKILKSWAYHHISVGDYVRLAKSKIAPSDVPYSLMVTLKKQIPGTQLNEAAAHQLIAHIDQKLIHNNVSVDGFPSGVNHLSLLRKDTIFVVMQCNHNLRIERLVQRSETSPRKWTDSKQSERDSLLDTLIAQLIEKQCELHYVDNNYDTRELQIQLAKILNLPLPK